MPSFYEAVARLFTRLNLACAILGGVMLIGVATIVFFEVMSRYLFGTSRLWVIEVSEYALLFITFLGAPYLLEKNQHVTLDLLYDSLSKSRLRVAKIFNSTLGLAICSILTLVGIRVVMDQLDTGVREATVMAPQSWWITLALPIGMFLMAFQFLDKGLRAFVGPEV